MHGRVTTQHNVQITVDGDIRGGGGGALALGPPLSAAPH